MPSHTRPTLGTLLRTLIEHLDGAVAASYKDSGLDYRPKYTPIVRTLLETGPATIQELSQIAAVSHSAASQTVSEMARKQLVETAPGADGRSRIVALTARGSALAEQLGSHWRATSAAALSLRRELSVPLEDVLLEALAALEKRSFLERIQASSKKQLRAAG